MAAVLWQPISARSASSVINVAWNHTSTTVTAFDSEPDGEVVSAGSNGSAYWNQIRQDEQGATFADLAMKYSDGSDAPVTVSATSGYTGHSGVSWSGKGDDFVMMDGWYGFKDGEKVAVSGVPAEWAADGYSVVIYGDSDAVSRTMRYTINGVTKTIVDAGTFGGTFVDGGNRVVFDGLSQTSFEITGNADGTPGRSAINGLQIIRGGQQQEPQVGAFDADDLYVGEGESVVLSWQVTGADSVTITPWPGDVSSLTEGGGGSVSVSVNQSTTFTLEAGNALGSVSESVTVHVGPERPNILLFLVDDMGTQDTSEPFQVNAQGEDVPTAQNALYRTPQMTLLANQGVKFTSAYAMPVCSPTRCSLMNGQNSVRHHVTNWTAPRVSPDGGGETGQNHVTSHNSPREWRRAGLDTSKPTLPALLSGAGYRSIHVGKGHFGNATDHNADPLLCGFDVNIGGKQIGQPGSYFGTANYGSGNFQVPHLEAYHGTNTFLTEALTLEMNRAIEGAVNDGVPFFAYMSHYALHAPFHEDPRFAGNYPSLSGSNGAYATLIEGMDKSLGDIRAKLEQLGVAEETLVIFLSDNGSDNPMANASAPLRGKKGQKWEGGSRVPMIVAWSKIDPNSSFQSRLSIPANRHEDDLVAVFDLFPTILNIAGVEYDQQVDGYDLQEYFKGNAGTHRPQELLIHFPHDHNSDYYTLLRVGEYKLIYTYHTDTFELYNVVSDIGESVDLAAAEPERVMEMARKMARQLAEHGAQWPTYEASPTDIDDPLVMPQIAGVDVDRDGIADNTEDANQNGLVDPGETDPDNDNSDGDNVPDGEEARIGTDPLDASSRFDVVPVVRGDGQLELNWPSAAGASFTIRSSGDLIDWSTVVADSVPAAGDGASATTYVVAGSEADRVFYRVELD
ncbi:sulfatase-like hydrolase/transferase [Sulfuriroseicoccus oceanibius]|uniref:Sulfatase-like hydrolase/transferase n=1 Tax=Sulfuriroseicoccus oceanibius TaxID=2707525 RepID=A0A6B3LEL9_9BACT|nr:sulfatase-like hydrolase/transferase [Sulfuriroseicoccus oceanibius]QQL45858.1 sulfatase-like hydrolase/transferase [Sulfuriroseicoccus oceanibius]